MQNASESEVRMQFNHNTDLLPYLSFDENIEAFVDRYGNLHTECNVELGNTPEEQCSISYERFSASNSEENQASAAEKLTLPSIPSNIEFSGEYNFLLKFQDNITPLTKSVPWAFSKRLNKLFAKLHAPCPVGFKVTGHPPRGSTVRALMIYADVCHVNDVVSRCLTHLINSAEEDQHAMHVVKTVANDAMYEMCPKSGRCSVRFPLPEVQAGTDCGIQLLTFGCFSSCAGGICRRPTQIIFTLENGNQQVIGRRTVNVRICACPGRDLTSAERNAPAPALPITDGPKTEDDDSSATELVSSDSDHALRIVHRNGNENNGLSRKGSATFTLDVHRMDERPSCPDDELFILTVRGEENFKLLYKINEGLEVVRKLKSGDALKYKSSDLPSGRLKDVARRYRVWNRRQRRDKVEENSSSQEESSSHLERYSVKQTIMLDQMQHNIPISTNGLE